MADATWTVTTRTRASAIFGLLAIGIVVVGFAAPAFVSRRVLVDLFSILTLLTLAPWWAGPAGLHLLIEIFCYLALAS